MLRVVINGRPHDCQEGVTLLEALRAADVRVPTLCHDKRLKPYGGCRLCLVQVDQLSRPVTACTTPAADGMRIDTHTPDIEALRRSLLTLIANEYPAEAYRREPDKEFHGYVRETALRTRFAAMPIRRSRTSRIPTFALTCPSACTASAAFGSVTSCRGSSSGACGIVETRRAFGRTVRIC